MWTSIFILFSLVCLCACQAPAIEEYALIPQPKEVAYHPGFVELKAQPVIAYQEGLANEARLLCSYLSTDFSMEAEMKEGASKADIALVIDSQVLPDTKEGYLLEVASGKVVIKGNSPAGVFYGVQTLRQMIREKEGKWKLQKAVIADSPAFSWRAFLLDEGRYFKGTEVVKGLLDQMAALKMNVFHWHLTEDQGWRIEIKKYPKLTEVGAFRDSTQINGFHSSVYDGKPHGGFYTQEQIRELVAYAAERHITIVPEIEMPGHASAAIAAYPWLGTSGKQIKVPCRFGVQYEVYNVADPKVIRFLEDVMDEVIALFPGEVFHIGGDEVRYDQWKASPAIRSYMAENQLNTPAELQVFFTNNVSNLLQTKQRRMMGWNEITGAKLHEYQSEKDTEAKDRQRLAPGTIVHFWKGDPALIKETIEKGYDVVNSYHEYTYVDYSYESIPLEKAYAFNPVPEELTPEQRNKVLGLGCQMWGEFIPTVESMNLKVYPRLAAYAETGWTAEDQKDYTRFLQALDVYRKKWDAAGIVYTPVQ